MKRTVFGFYGARGTWACALLVAWTSAAAGQTVADTAPTMFSVGALKVIHQRRSANQIVVAQLYLLGGARQVTAKTAGIEPLILRTAQLGSATYPGRAMQLALARTGSTISVSARPDWTVATLRTIRPELDSAWAVFASRIMQPTLDPADLAKIRLQMVTEGLQAAGDPDALVRQIARSMAFAGHPYANDPAGSDAALRTLTAETVLAYHEEQFVTSRMLLVVVGNVDRAKVEQLAASTIANLPAGSYSWTLPPPIPRRTAGMQILPRKLESDYIIGIFPGPTSDSRDNGGFRIATALLGSRLNQVIREQEHLSYAAYAPLYDDAAMSGAVYASTTQPEKVMELLVKQIEGVQNNSLSYVGLARFTSQFALETLAEQESNAGQAFALARGQLLFGDFRKVDAPLKALSGAGEDRINTVASRYIPFVQFVFVGDTARFRRYLR